MRQLILAPVIIAMAFTLHSRTMCVIQIIAGVAYGTLGIAILWCEHSERRQANGKRE